MPDKYDLGIGLVRGLQSGLDSYYQADAAKKKLALEQQKEAERQKQRDLDRMIRIKSSGYKPVYDENGNLVDTVLDPQAFATKVMSNPLAVGALADRGYVIEMPLGQQQPQGLVPQQQQKPPEPMPGMAPGTPGEPTQGLLPQEQGLLKEGQQEQSGADFIKEQLAARGFDINYDDKGYKIIPKQDEQPPQGQPFGGQREIIPGSRPPLPGQLEVEPDQISQGFKLRMLPDKRQRNDLEVAKLKAELADKGYDVVYDVFGGGYRIVPNKQGELKGRQQEAQIKKAEADAKVAEESAAAKIKHAGLVNQGLINKSNLPKKPQVTPAQKSVDTAFGKDYAEWVTRGAAEADANILAFEEAISKLNQPGRISGGPTSYLPEVGKKMFNKDLIQVRDKIRTAIQSGLRAVLGAQYTEKEGMAMFSRAFDENLSDQDNIERASTQLTKLKQMRQDKENAVGYYEDNGTLQGFKFRTNINGELGGGSGLISPKAQPQGKVKMSNGKETLWVDKADQKAAESDGYKVVK